MNTKIMNFGSAILFAMLGFACSTPSNTAPNNTTATNTAPVVRDIASGKCDAEAFVNRIRAKCTLSNNDASRIKRNGEYCKQLANRFQIVTMENSGDVVVLDTQTCDRTKYEVDASGIDTLKIIQSYAYMTSRDGQLYIYSSHSKKFFELRSNSGNSYSRANQSNVIDLKGGQGGTIVTTTHANGAKQDWDSDKINSMDSKRLRQLQFWTYGTNGSVYND